MKIVIPDAILTAVTSHAEKNGEERIPGGKSLTIEATVPPRMLNELQAGLIDVFYEDGIPRVEGLGWCEWLLEYEKAICQITPAGEDAEDEEEEDAEAGDPKKNLTFTKADVKKLAFLVRPGFLVDLKFTVRINANKAQHGELDYLLQQKVRIAIKKATQVRIEEKAKSDGADKQPALPGTEGAPPTTDGKPIEPLLKNEPEPATS
jgi:hypothetical protein